MIYSDISKGFYNYDLHILHSKYKFFALSIISKYKAFS